MLQSFEEYLEKSRSPITTCASLKLIVVSESKRNQARKSKHLTSFDIAFTFFTDG